MGKEVVGVRVGCQVGHGVDGSQVGDCVALYIRLSAGDVVSSITGRFVGATDRFGLIPIDPTGMG